MHESNVGSLVLWVRYLLCPTDSQPWACSKGFPQWDTFKINCEWLMFSLCHLRPISFHFVFVPESSDGFCHVSEFCKSRTNRSISVVGVTELFQHKYHYLFTTSTWSFTAAILTPSWKKSIVFFFQWRGWDFALFLDSDNHSSLDPTFDKISLSDAYIL